MSAGRSMRVLARIFWFLLALVVIFGVVGIATIKFLDTDRGRAFVIRQLPLYAPRSGLTVRAGRIDGSLFGKATIHDLQLGDPQGVFARAPRVDLDWRPFDLAHKTLTIHDLLVPDIFVLRRPVLRPSAEKRILPDIDIMVAHARIDRIVLEAPVTGARRIASLSGNADIRNGRALLNLDAGAPPVDGKGGGDSVRVRLDARPDQDRFDIDARVAAPVGGVVAGLLGLKAPLALTVAGDGRWTRWQGRATATLGTASLANLALTAENGQFGASGDVVPGTLLTGVAARLSAPKLAVNATAFVADRRADITLRAASPALRLDAAGRLDFGEKEFSGLTVSAQLLQPKALNPQLSGRDIRLVAKLAGTFKAPLVDYVVTSPALAFGRTAFAEVRAIGIVATGPRPIIVPLTVTARRVTGVGVTAEALLTNVRVSGPLTLRGLSLTSNTLVLRSDRLSGNAVAAIDLDTGVFNVALKGNLPNYLVPGLGITNITADLRAVPDGRGARVTGQVAVKVARLDNPFFSTLLEGLPAVTAAVNVAPDNSLSFSNARLVAPGLTMTAAGTRTPEGFVRLTGSGVSRKYGPLTLALAGQIEKPVVDLVLAQPGFGIGLAKVAGHIAPVGANWSFDATGTTSYGPITGRGLIRADVQPAAIDIAAVTLAGVTGRGTLVQTPAGPFAGRMALSGGGVTGSAILAAAGDVQRADIAFDAVNARLPMVPPVAVGKASLRATVLLPDAGPVVTGSFTAAELRRQDVLLTDASGSVDYRAGRGSAQLTAHGIANAPFSIESKVAFEGDRIEITGDGIFNKRRVGLDKAAVVTRDRSAGGDDWVLAPTVLTTPDGRAELSGRFGTTRVVRARLDNLGLSLLALVNPSFDFGGRVSGTIDMQQVPGALPVGTASLRVNGLSRANVAAASLPIDLGINAAIGANGGSARAVIVRGGAVEGRVQAQVRAIPATGSVMERLLAASLFAQARYVGPAQALWPLAGIEALDVRGPVQVTADIGGHLGEPTLSGTITSDGARVENVTLGTVVEQVHLDSRFTASRLELTSFSGTIGKAGTVSGSGSIGLSADQGFPIDIKVALKNAQALKRDDLTATVTGDMQLRSNRSGARITGNLVANQALFRIGRPASAEVPVLAVRELNAEAVRRRVTPVEKPAIWALDIGVKIPERVVVQGMGLQSDWRGELQIGGTVVAPSLTGRVRLIRGDYDFAGKRFSLTRGDLRFPGGYPPDPVVDIVAENTSSSFTATLTISGTGLHPEIAFGSVPSLPQDEVLSRVLFGTSIASLSAPEALQLAGALASLRGGGKGGEGFNPINIVRKGLGIDRLRILPADTTTGRKTSIAAGQYIGKRVYVELASDAQGYTATNIEVALTRSLSILSQVATLGGTSVNLRLKKDY
ncbi:translocation/assembly module TamB domain-containing protein [Glacieibacterium sp.]|uniref:translocation/assembly module TamB domain-containing protein n=1 Tax=Glacieibacterium sp. TaxID=2860237 RepID=UPI003AFF6F0D